MIDKADLAAFEQKLHPVELAKEKYCIGMVSFIEDIIEFQHKYGQLYVGPPRALPTELRQVRMDKLIEEYDEWMTSSHDSVEELDATVDLIYILIGTALLKGWNLEEAWNRVHYANMHGKKREGEDIIKDPHNFKAPDLYDLVKGEDE